MHNGKYQYNMSASCTYRLLSSPSCPTRTTVQKSLILDPPKKQNKQKKTKKLKQKRRMFWKKVRVDHQQK